MDRTAEFFKQVAAAGGSSSRAPASSAGASTAYGDAHASSFTRAAAQVGKDLHMTAAKVQQLTKREWGGGGASARHGAWSGGGLGVELCSR